MTPVPFIFEIIGKRNMLGGKEAFRELLMLAMEKWAAVCGAVFREAYPTEQPNLRFRFVERIWNDSDSIDAYAITSESDGITNVEFDENQEWVLGLAPNSRNQGVDLYSLILHELGHVLGIRHEQLESKSDVMHFGYVGKKTDLTSADIRCAQLKFGPSFYSFGHPIPNAAKCQLMPIGDYVYLLNPTAERGKLIIHRSHDLRVWTLFSEMDIPENRAVMANHSGMHGMLIGFLPSSSRTEPSFASLKIIHKTLQWQVPERSKSVANRLALPLMASAIRLGTIPVSYCDKTVWGFVDNYNQIRIVHHDRGNETHHAVAAPNHFKPTEKAIEQLELAHVNNSSLFAFWRVGSEIFFTHDASLFQLSANAAHISKLENALPVGRFSVVSIGFTVFVAWLEKPARLVVQAFEFDSGFAKKLKPTDRFEISVPPAIAGEEQPGTRIFYRAGKLFTAISTDTILHFVEH